MTLRVTPAEIVDKAEASGNAGLLAKAEHWTRIRLGDVAQVINGSPFKSSLFNVDGVGMPLIRIRDVGAVGASTWYNGPFDEAHRVRQQDLLVGMDGDFRLARWCSADALLNQRVCRIDVDTTRFDDRFLALVLQGYLDAIWNATSSTTVKHLSSRSIAEIPLPFPEIDEQRRIVGILEDHLSHLDAAEHGLKLSLRRLASYEAVALSLCRDGIESPLGEVTEIQGGIQKQPKRAPRQNAHPFLRVANVTKMGLDLDEVHLVELFEGELGRLRLQIGDLLVVEGNGSPSQIGRAALWDGSIADCVHQNHLIRVRPKPGLSAAYLEAVWNSPQNRRQLTDLASSSSGLHTLSVSKLKTLKLPLPTQERQMELVAEVQDVRDRRRRLATSLDLATARSKQLRRSLLSAAFAGRLTGRTSDREVVEEMADV